MWCRKLSELWRDSFVKSEKFASPLPSGDYWLIASGLGLQKMTPDQLGRYLQSKENTQSEDRLRSYFFEGIWEKLPEISQQALIAADRIFSAPEGRRYSLISELRHAVEPIVQAMLVDPFKAWLDARSIKFNESKRQRYLPLSRQVDELWTENEELFEKYLRAQYPSVAAEFWGYLSSALLALRENRSKAEHPEDKGIPANEAMKNLYGLFLGIERKGIIRMLMELDTAEPPDNDTMARHKGV